MRIDKFHITHYGPLPDRGEVNLSDFNLVYGVNETGKTLTLEALIKLLLGSKVKDFKGINRVNEMVDGYVIVNAENEEKKLGRKTHLDDIVPITARECRNIFVIRNSDLSIESEAAFYTEITNRLTGLQTSRIEDVRKKILEISSLTPGGDFSNRREDNYLKTKIEDAYKLLDDIKSLKYEIEENRIEQLEEEWVRLFDEIKLKEILRGKLEEARKRFAYENAASALNKIDEGKKILEDLTSFREEDFTRWRDAERETKRVEKELIKMYDVLRESKTKIKKIEDELKEKESDFQLTRRRKEKIDGLKSKLADIKNQKIEASSKSSLTLLSKSTFFIVSAIFAISLLGMILEQMPVFIVMTAVFSIFFFVLLGLILKSNRNIVLFRRNFEKLKMDLAEIGFKGEEIEDLLGEVEAFSLKFGEKEGDINIKKVELGTLRNVIEEIQEERAPELKRKMERNTEIVQEIKTATFVDSLERYGENLRRKQGLEREIEKEESVLEGILGKENRREKIQELKFFKDKAKDVEFNEKEYDVLNQEISLSRERLGELEGNLNVLGEGFKEVEKKANRILSDKDLRCHGSRDLENIENKIEGFIKEKEIAKEDAEISLEILGEIENEEKAKIREQFGPKSSISKYFSQMTGGLYTSVEFEEKEEKIIVVRKDEKVLYPWQLSSGTYDQLYFSIRLSLGEELFGGEKGFFILDDPFVKASRNRLKILMNMLKDISESGWQIIYFSAKDEVRKILRKDKRIQIVKLGKIF
jgi:DNA repair exonuclease SbcCD ATPase subunit